MSLEFADYARFYANSGMSEDAQREDFEVYSCFMECLVRYFFEAEPKPNPLGISVSSDTLSPLGALGCVDIQDSQARRGVIRAAGWIGGQHGWIERS